MKFDLHCHTKEGSIDAKVKIEDYVRLLISKGFDGMLVTDHNSYKGYEKWQNIKNNITLSRPFVVLKGIEYDTRDGGHFIVILPDGVHSELIAVRGMTVHALVKAVHRVGGILGPAHPFDTGYYAFMNTRTSRRHPDLVDQFDFIETYNSCAKVFANTKAQVWALSQQKPGISGSDSHRAEVVGTAYTDFDEPVYNNNDLIKAIKEHTGIQITEDVMVSMKLKVSRFTEKAGIYGYWLYNKLAVLRFARKRRVARLHELAKFHVT